MTILQHALLFFFSAVVIWFLSGLLIDATERVAKRFKKPRFAVAFFVLGLLTSISEISVATNATLQGVPQVSAGNLLGASLVIVIFIIPLLAILGDGIPLNKVLSHKTLALILAVVTLPAFLALDGVVSVNEGIGMVLLYAALFYFIQQQHTAERTAAKALHATKRELLHTTHATAIDIGKIAVGGILIFVAGNFLVDESIYFASLFAIPVSFVGLLVLSLGTNIPELVIAVRCVLGRHKDIAFGDYMGSIAANTPIFGLLAIANGTFSVERSEVVLTFGVFVIGLTLFYVFLRSGRSLSRAEGLCLLGVYAAFLIFQVGNAVRLSGESTYEALEGPDAAQMLVEADARNE